jgi:putative phosphoribosyl transferase
MALADHPPLASASFVLASAAEKLAALDDPAFGEVFDRFAQSRVVLLGEASHGTSDFYRARAAITRRLIERHGFTIVAVEADWPDAAAIDRYVRNRPNQPLGRPPSPASRPGCGATLTWKHS